jgi:hypothetical protein
MVIHGVGLLATYNMKENLLKNHLVYKFSGKVVVYFHNRIHLSSKLQETMLQELSKVLKNTTLLMVVIKLPEFQR